jgi:hypothetical protein
MFEFIYLLQTRESLRNNEEIYKVGRTCKSELERFNNYPKGSILHLHISCVNSCEVENNIINSFNKIFTNVGLYGREYFEGNLLEMLTIILQQVSLSFNCLSSSIGYCKKLQQYENINNALNIKVVKLQLENDLLKQDNNISRQKDHKENTDIDFNNEKTNITVDKDDANLQCKKSNRFVCSKCSKPLTSKRNLENHESKCDGLESRQCKICFKLFTTQQAKWKHNKNVNCSPPILVATKTFD